jgi:hypothetical protein
MLRGGRARRHPSDMPGCAAGGGDSEGERGRRVPRGAHAQRCVLDRGRAKRRTKAAPGAAQGTQRSAPSAARAAKIETIGVGRRRVPRQGRARRHASNAPGCTECRVGGKGESGRHMPRGGRARRCMPHGGRGASRGEFTIEAACRAGSENGEDRRARAREVELVRKVRGCAGDGSAAGVGGRLNGEPSGLKSVHAY